MLKAQELPIACHWKQPNRITEGQLQTWDTPLVLIADISGGKIPTATNMCLPFFKDQGDHWTPGFFLTYHVLYSKIWLLRIKVIEGRINPSVDSNSIGSVEAEVWAAA